MLQACTRRERVIAEVLIVWVIEVTLEGNFSTENIRSTPITKPRLELRLGPRHENKTLITTPQHRPHAEREAKREGTKVRVNEQALRQRECATLAFEALVGCGKRLPMSGPPLGRGGARQDAVVLKLNFMVLSLQVKLKALLSRAFSIRRSAAEA
jgi:hypothetical protein